MLVTESRILILGMKGTGSEIFPREPSGHALGCQNVVQPSSTTESEQVFALGRVVRSWVKITLS